MWNRKDLKARGKAACLANYWKCVLVALILAALVGSSGGAARTSSQTSGSDIGNEYLVEMQEEAMNKVPLLNGVLELRETFSASQPLRGVRISLGLGSSLVMLLLSILVFNPLIVGCYRFFLQNSRGLSNLRELGAGFRDDWGNVVLTMFLKNLFIFLWALLFIGPGIVKA